MATLIATASGNWTSASTWKVANSVAELDGETYTNFTEVAASPSWGASSTFSFAGTVEIDAIAVKIYLRATSPSGTFSVCIGQSGSPVAGTTVTVNTTDILHAVTAGHSGWMIFKLSSPVTLSASTNYTVMAQESTAADDVRLLTNGTSSNWLRQLRTTTTQAPTTGDKLIIGGEWTAASTVTSITVTMNNNDTTDYGTGSTTIPSLSIVNYGTLSFSYNASTVLRLSGLLYIYAGGTLSIGTVANPIGSSYTAKLEFDCAAAGDFGITKLTHGIYVVQGASRTYDRCMLAADAAQSATSITTSVSTGWKDGDIIAIASTDRVATHCDYCTLSGDASGTTINLTAGLSWAHSSATLTQAEIILLTRNVIITSVNSSYKAYMANSIGVGTTTTGYIDIDWAQFLYFGTGSTTGKEGAVCLANNLYEIESAQRCSFVTCGSAVYTAGSGESVHTVSYNVCYNSGRFFHGGSSSVAGTPTISENWVIGNASASDGMLLGTISGTITNNRISGHSYGILCTGIGPIGTFSGNVSHCNSTGIRLSSTKNGTISNCTAWFNTVTGLHIHGHIANIIFDNIILYGNTTRNILIEAGGSTFACKFTSGSLNGYSGYDTIHGLDFVREAQIVDLLFDGTSFGVTSGSLIAHTGYSVSYDTYWLLARVNFHNCTWGSGTKFHAISSIGQPYFAGYSKDGGTEGNDYSEIWNGQLIHNASAGDGGGDCLEIVPTGNTGYCDLSLYMEKYPIFQCPAKDGVTRTVYIKLKKTATLDSTNVSLALYQNGTLVDGWDNVVSSLSSSAYTEFSLSYTPTEDGILDMAIKLDGDAGSLYVDSFRWI